MIRQATRLVVLIVIPVLQAGALSLMPETLAGTMMRTDVLVRATFTKITVTDSPLNKQGGDKLGPDVAYIAIMGAGTPRIRWARGGST